jgi:hypothetical protein
VEPEGGKVNKITFSHNYPKLWEQKTATLLAVRELNFPADKNEDLIMYDTSYYTTDPPYTGCGAYSPPNYYKLRNGPYIQLIFIGDKHIPFCTLRPKYNGWCKDRLGYYKSKIGQVFNVVIKEAQ